jgi:imidazolonepropionase-like amidohydrolase
VWNIRPITREGGNFPRWASGGRLVAGSANEVFLFDAASGKTERYPINLAVPRDVAAGAVALTGARIITMTDAGVIEEGDIAIADGRISAVGPSGSIAIPAGATRIDARGKTIMPGLVDLHTHNHRSPNGIIPQRDYEMGASLAYGVTTTLDNSMWSQNIFPQAEMVDAGEIVGPRVYSTGDPLYAGDHARQNELKSLEQTRQEVRRLKSYGAVSLKQYQQPERRQRQWVSEAARTEGMMVTAEGGDMLYILTMVMDGQTGWEHPIPQVPVYDDLAQFLGRARIHYSSTLVVAGPGPWNDQYWIQQSELWTDPKLQRFSPWRKLEAHTRRRDLRPVTDYTFPFLAQGVADIIKAGGYGAIGAHGQQHGIASQWEVWMLASAMPPLEALRVATMHGATMIGVQEDLGSLAAGKLADLIVLNGNPLQDIRQTANIQYVMKGGRIYNGDNLDEIWPRKRPFGKFFWETENVRPTDVKVIK